MTADDNKAFYRRFLQEIFNNGHLELIDEMVSPSYVLHDAPPGLPPGPDAIRHTVTMFRGAFPDLEITVEELLAERDLVCARSTTRGTHSGDAIFGIAATGKAVTMTGLTMVRIADGKLAESWVKNDVMGLMNQLK